MIATKKRKGSGAHPGVHKFKWLKYKGEKVRIDRDIAPLLTDMWELGINTVNCCQARCGFNCKCKPTKRCRDNVWIVFETSYDIELFYNIVAEYVKEEWGDCSNNRYINILGQLGNMYPSDTWAIIFVPRNNGVKYKAMRPTIDGKRFTHDVWTDGVCKKNNFVMQPQLTFPRKHLSYVEGRLKLAIKKK